MSTSSKNRLTNAIFESIATSDFVLLVFKLQKQILGGESLPYLANLWYSCSLKALLFGLVGLEEKILPSILLRGDESKVYQTNWQGLLALLKLLVRKPYKMHNRHASTTKFLTTLTCFWGPTTSWQFTWVSAISWNLKTPYLGSTDHT